MIPAACIELRDFPLAAQIGSYGPGQVAPEQHLLDLTLWIAAQRVLVHQDGMDPVFDYDPLVLEVERLAGEGHYETQERVLTRIAQACAGFAAIEALEIALRKRPMRPNGGSLGVRLVLDAEQLQGLRTLKAEQGTP